MCGNRMRNNNKILLILSFLLVWNFLSAQTRTPDENDSIKFKFNQKYISVSPLISPRICLGLTSTCKLENQHLQETIIYFHAFDTFSTYKVYGIAARAHQFFAKNQKTGFFWIMNAGFDYIQMEPLFSDPGGSNVVDDEIDARIAPNLTIGLGYSIKLENNSYIRLEWDVGYKWFISNIYISYVW